MSGSKNRKHRKSQRDSGFDLGNQKDREAEQGRRKQTRTAIIVLIVIAVVAAVVLLLNSNLFYRNMTAVNVDGERFSIVDMNFYTAMAAARGADFDAAVEDAVQEAVLHNRAVAEGLELDDAARAQVQATLDWARDGAAEWGVSVDQFLSDSQIGAGFGRGHRINLRVLEDRVAFTALGNMYRDHFQERLWESYTEAEMETFYMENREQFDRIQFRVLNIPFTAVDASELEDPDDFIRTRQEAEDLAQRVITAAANGEAAFLTTAGTVMSEMGNTAEADAHTWRDMAWNMVPSDYADWLQAAARTTGDAEVFTGDTSVFAVFYVDLDENRYHSVNVRRILVQAEEIDFFDEDGEVLDPDIIEAAQEAANAAAWTKAEEILAQWHAGEATEASFIELIREYSDDNWEIQADPGLIDNIGRQSLLAPEFRVWALDSARRIGDVEIVETSFGLHIMYFVSENTEIYHRHELARETMSAEAFEAWFEEAVEAANVRETFFSRLVNRPDPQPAFGW